MSATSDGGMYYFRAGFLKRETVSYPNRTPFAFSLNHRLAFNAPHGRDPGNLFNFPQEDLDYDEDYLNGEIQMVNAFPSPPPPLKGKGVKEAKNKPPPSGRLRPRSTNASFFCQ
ncbi:hypothetical protein CLV84_2167 [Neolewinella xylanilytica]|uniref:Uncharacterized protein n=1 Tax=Neolewinella xylanilytica TaxID=1514080 RepID=A0A2S6I274_9BACT|nr:hypothetical protein CLV84_2167 [Neolewinella xylanilytica]